MHEMQGYPTGWGGTIMRVILAIMLLLSATVTVFANSVPDSGLGESGDVVPVSRNDVGVVSERLLIVMPPAAQYDGKARVRAEYKLKLDKKITKPCVVDIGFPISYPWMRDTEYSYGDGSIPHAAVKLNGHAVHVQFLNLEQLARPTIEAWLNRVDKGLQRFPDLQKLINIERAKGTRRSINDSCPSVESWLQKYGGQKLNAAQDEHLVALGLIGVATLDDESRVDQPLQHALAWLDLNYKEINLTQVLSDRWGHKQLMLSTYDHKLYEPNIGELFGVLQFRIELAPGKLQTLVVEYQQPLGFSGLYMANNRTEYSSCGFRYIMANAHKWQSWGSTAIEIRIPRDWHDVAIHPQAHLISSQKGMRIYRIKMGMPTDALYVSTDPPLHR
jgi:hypothetical protein